MYRYYIGPNSRKNFKDPNYKGHIFGVSQSKITETKNMSKMCDVSRQGIFITGPSDIVYDVDNQIENFTKKDSHKFVWLETTSEYKCINSGLENFPTMKTKIYVDAKAVTGNNTWDGIELPLDKKVPVCVLIKENFEEIKFSTCKILGPSLMVYKPYNPLQNGGTVWIETDSEIEILT